MSLLSEYARLIRDRMEPDRSYRPQDLQAFVPEITSDGLRQVMHELWIERQVERVGYSGWRRLCSAPPHRHQAASGPVTIVKPEELFDHEGFADFFTSP